MRGAIHILILALIFLAGAWVGTKYPQVNLIAKVTG